MYFVFFYSPNAFPKQNSASIFGKFWCNLTGLWFHDYIRLYPFFLSDNLNYLGQNDPMINQKKQGVTCTHMTNFGNMLERERQWEREGGGSQHSSVNTREHLKTVGVGECVFSVCGWNNHCRPGCSPTANGG